MFRKILYYRQPVGRVIVSALCALAKGGHKVQEVRQAADGCMLLCEIPSDLFSLAGQLLVTIDGSRMARRFTGQRASKGSFSIGAKAAAAWISCSKESHELAPGLAGRMAPALHPPHQPLFPPEHLLGFAAHG